MRIASRARASTPTPRRAQVIRDKKEAEFVAKKLFKDRPGPPSKVKGARKLFKDAKDAVKLKGGGGAKPPSDAEAVRNARRLMKRMSRKGKGKGKKHRKSFKKGLLR